MSGFKYLPSPDEKHYAEYLREKGWSVYEPRCPLCKGGGRVNQKMWWSPDEPHPTEAEIVGDPCPNGCPVPMRF